MRIALVIGPDETKSGQVTMKDLLTGKQQSQLREFKRPAPMREVSLVVHRDFVKKRLVEILKKEIIAAVPDKIRKNKAVHVLPI